MKKWQGAKWITPERRARIYARDNHCCVYCLRERNQDQLQLDHIKPRSAGGSNHSTNLVTCCRRCNSSRQKSAMRAFCLLVAERTGQNWRDVWFRVRNARRRVV